MNPQAPKEPSPMLPDEGPEPSRPNPVNAYSVVQAPGGAPDKHLLMLHGILGRGGNWRAVAKRFVEAHPQWSAILVDLRAHGRSQHLVGADSVAESAADLGRLARTLELPVAGVLGHSFGGKVALAYAADAGADLEKLFIVDSLPGARPDRFGSEGTTAVLEMLRGLPTTFATRQDFQAAIVDRGHGLPLAQWLAMNLRREGEAFVFGLDLDRIETLLEDYFQADLWPLLEAKVLGADTHLIAAGRSTVISEQALAHARGVAAAAESRLWVHRLPDAGHWVHVDDPDGLHRILEEQGA